MKDKTQNSEQKYFDSVKPYGKHKNHNILDHFAVAILKAFTKAPEIIYSEKIKDEPVVFLSNHATRYGPTAMHVYFPGKHRIWVLSSLFYVKTFSNHMMVYWFPNVRGLIRILCRIFTLILAPIGPFFYKSMEAIPVYRMSLKLKDTYDKTVETLIEGKNVVIFPESRESSVEYKFVNNLQNGFFRFASTYYLKTGKRLLAYPVYCCKELNIISVGKPYEYDPDINMKEQSLTVMKYIQDSIEELAKSLPEHEAYPYNKEIKDIEYINKKYNGIF
jgi:hypothetical protein